MSVTRIAVLIIGIILAVFGLYTVLQSGLDVIRIIIGVVLILVGVYLISGRGITL